MRSSRRGVTRRCTSLGIAIAGVLAGVETASAADINWTGDGSTNSWGDTGNWDLLRVPTINDVAYIPGGIHVFPEEQNASVALLGGSASSVVLNGKDAATIMHQSGTLT